MNPYYYQYKSISNNEEQYIIYLHVYILAGEKGLFEPFCCVQMGGLGGNA